MDSPCYVAALRILKYRFNSEAELRRKLRSKKFEREEIDLAMARLQAEKWLDDERFAGSFVRTRIQKSIGRLRIRRELQAAGVADEAAQRALSENVDADREQDDLSAACRKRMRVLARKHGEAWLSTEEGRSKIASYLMTRGYDSRRVWETVRTETESERRRLLE